MYNGKVENLINFIKNFRRKFLLNREKVDELFNKRVNFLIKKQYEYYYTMAINCPETLCETLAIRDIENIKQKNLVINMYTKAKR